VTGLNTRVTTAETEITSLRTDLDAVLAAMFRITMTTARANFALGELAEITATVRDAHGQIPSAGTWVDFVSTWGTLKAAPGFVAESGVGSRSMSVQTNSQGIAKARLASELVHDASEDLEVDFSAFLETRTGPQNFTIAETILASNTPSDQNVAFAYQAMSASYDNVQASSVREYADSYYVANGSKLSGKVSVNTINKWRQQWRDYQITVLAFGKSDDDPTTADAPRGASSIQITFRDWLGPWIIVDYIPNFKTKVPDLVNIFHGSIAPDYTESAFRIKDKLQARVQNFGLLGKTREYEAAREAMDQLNPPGNVPFLGQLKDSMKSAVTLQQSFQAAQVNVLGGGADEVALQAFTTTAVRADSGVEGVNEQVKAVTQQLQQFQSSTLQQFSNVQQNVTALGGRLDATVSSGGHIDQLRANLSNVSDQVQALRALGDPTFVSDRINLVASLDNRLTKIERGGTG
jgi:hypothetical protein